MSRGLRERRDAVPAAADVGQDERRDCQAHDEEDESEEQAPPGGERVEPHRQPLRTVDVLPQSLRAMSS